MAIKQQQRTAGRKRRRLPVAAQLSESCGISSPSNESQQTPECGSDAQHLKLRDLTNCPLTGTTTQLLLLQPQSPRHCRSKPRQMLHIGAAHKKSFVLAHIKLVLCAFKIFIGSFSRQTSFLSTVSTVASAATVSSHTTRQMSRLS